MRALRHPSRLASARRAAFTLIELLVVIGITASLLAILLSALSSARAHAKAAVCGSNIRQIALANEMYAQENSSRCVPGASDFLMNLNRWHGARSSASAVFDPARGPLVSYLGMDRTIRDCPALPEFRTGAGAFERGCGGYGYNNAYVGVQLRRSPSGSWLIETDLVGTSRDFVTQPAQTVYFTDAAFASNGLIEYSFAEARFHVTSTHRADPSIHFRHRAIANTAWGDGHVTAEKRTYTWSSGLYTSDPASENIGWFGETDDNRLFDLD